MTVVATFITRTCTVQASDSLLTAIKPDGATEHVEWENTKIVPVAYFRGSIAYYGFAGWVKGWTLLDWLRTEVQKAKRHPSAQAFGEHLAGALQSELMRLKVSGTAGVGLHFSAYERMNDYSIPELFHISNWLETSYVGLRPDGVGCTRESWGVITGNGSSLDHGTAEHRMRVHEHLQGGKWLRFNNGDPALFNTVANALQDAVSLLRDRGRLRNLGVPEHIALTQRFVELVAEIQRDVGRAEDRRVGGRIHNLAITPDGRYSSTSGDEP